MTSKSTVSWGQQGGPGGRAGRESRLESAEGALPVSHARCRQFTAVAPRASLVTENSPQSRLSRVLTAFPHSLLSTLGQVTGLLWACRGQSQAELEGASAPSPSSDEHRRLEGMTHAETHRGLLPPVLSRGTLGFLTGTPAPTFPFFSFFLTLLQKIDAPFHLICILFPLHALPPGSSLPPARFSSLCPCPAPQEAQLFPCPHYASSSHLVPLSCLLIDSAPLVAGIISLPIFNCVMF